MATCTKPNEQLQTVCDNMEEETFSFDLNRTCRSCLCQTDSLLPICDPNECAQPTGNPGRSTQSSIEDMLLACTEIEVRNLNLASFLARFLVGGCKLGSHRINQELRDTEKSFF